MREKWRVRVARIAKDTSIMMIALTGAMFLMSNMAEFVQGKAVTIPGLGGVPFALTLAGLSAGLVAILSVLPERAGDTAAAVSSSNGLWEQVVDATYSASNILLAVAGVVFLASDWIAWTRGTPVVFGSTQMRLLIFLVSWPFVVALLTFPSMWAKRRPRT